MSDELVKYEVARHALADARSIDEVKVIHDKAEALRIYAIKAKDWEFVWWAAELKLDAERKGGGILAGMNRSQGGRPKNSQHAVDSSEYQKGVSHCGTGRSGYVIAERWQLSHSVSKANYEVWKDGLRGETYPTSSGLRNFAKRETAKQENGPHRTNSVADLAALADSGEQFSVIYADPP